MSTDFLIHRDSEGRIVRAVPYVNIYSLIIEDNHVNPSNDWRVAASMIHGFEVYFSTTQADAERYLAEWREWWEKHETTEKRLNECVSVVKDHDTILDRMDEDLAFLMDPKHHTRREDAH